MKESLVGRDELEACQAELAASREEVARLDGQLAATERERSQPVQQMNGNFNHQDHHSRDQQFQQQDFFEGDDESGSLPQYLRSNHPLHRGALGSYASRYATGHDTPTESEIMYRNDSQSQSGNGSFYHEETDYNSDYPTQTPKMSNRRSISNRSVSAASNSNTHHYNQKVEVAKNADGWWD